MLFYVHTKNEHKLIKPCKGGGLTMAFNYKIIDDGSFCITSYKGKEEHVVIPDHLGATILYDDLFKAHTEITSVVIPDTITNIGGFVFDGCINLKSITLPKNLNNMWQYALTRCGIETITIPGNVTSIVPFTFYQCRNLKTVILSEGTKKICSWAFKDCASLTEVYLPSSLTEISEKAFEGCEHIKLTPMHITS